MKVTPVRVTQEEYELFRHLVEERSGIALPSIRRLNLEQAIGRALETCGYSEPMDLYDHLRSVPGHTDLESFISSLTVGETYFFRNTPQFEALEKHVLPELIQERSHERRLRIWSAGCSSGEEPYSLAMLLERMLPEIDSWNISILATDINRDALVKASRARYRSWSFRGVPAEIQARYFIARGDELELDVRLRQMVRFEYLNLTEDSYPSLVTNTNEMDLIVCRNVLIYFRDATARSVIARLHRCMADDGWLFLGHSEPSYWLSDRFSPHSFDGAIGYHRRGIDKSREQTALGQPPGPLHSRPAPPVTPHGGRSRARPRRTGESGMPPPPVEQSVAERCRLVLTRWETSDPERALVELEGLATENASDPRPPYLVAKMHANRLQTDAAERWTTVSLQRDPLFAPAHYVRGVVAAEDGRPEDAVEAYRRCVYADPQWPLGHFAFADTLLRIGQVRRAAAALSNLERLVKDVPPEQEVPDGDGLTIGRLRELAHMQLEIHGLGGVSR